MNADASPRRIVRDSAHETSQREHHADAARRRRRRRRRRPTRTPAENAAPTKIVAEHDQRREPAVAGHEVVGEDRDQALARRVDDARRDDAGRVAAEPHRHRQRLLAVRAGALEQEVEVERDPRQVAEILEDREQREEDRHRRQHHADDPRQAAIDAVPDEAGDPPRARRRDRRAPRPDPRTRRNPSASIADGTLAPAIVSQNTTRSSSAMIGRPKTGDVTMPIDALIEVERARSASAVRRALRDRAWPRRRSSAPLRRGSSRAASRAARRRAE